MIKVAPSILSADFANLASEVEALEKAGADMLHIDVMDGHFVPNITIGPCVINSLRQHTELLFDVHLMISSPEKYIKDFKEAGADIITIHYEATDSISNVLKLIKDNEVKCGVSLMPGTSYKVLEDIIHELDLVLVMTVEPGFGGQTFMSDQIQKISFLSQIIKKKNPKCLLAVDGGINDITGAECKKAGANVLVAGSYIFKNKQQITEDNYQEYTSSTSKVARKTSGELAQPILIGEHKRIPKFDVANLEVQEVYMPLVNEELDRRQLTWTRTRSFEPSSGAYIRYVSSTGRRKRRRQLFKLAEYTSNINKLRLC